MGYLADFFKGLFPWRTKDNNVEEKRPFVDERDADLPRSQAAKWYKILKSGDPASAEYKAAFDGLLQSTRSLEDLRLLYEAIGDKSSYAVEVIHKIELQLAPFGDWVTAYDDASYISEFSNTILKKAMALAKTALDWMSVWDTVEDSSDEDLYKVKAEMKQLEWPREQWEYFQDEGDDDQEHFALEQLLKFAETVPSLLDFYQECQNHYFSMDERLAKQIFTKLFSLATRQEIQIMARLAEDDDYDLANAAARYLEQ